MRMGSFLKIAGFLKHFPAKYLQLCETFAIPYRNRTVGLTGLYPDSFSGIFLSYLDRHGSFANPGWHQDILHPWRNTSSDSDNPVRMPAVSCSQNRVTSRCSLLYSASTGSATSPVSATSSTFAKHFQSLHHQAKFPRRVCYVLLDVKPFCSTGCGSKPCNGRP